MASQNAWDGSGHNISTPSYELLAELRGSFGKQEEQVGIV
jgi:hypothetical protein